MWKRSSPRGDQRFAAAYWFSRREAPTISVTARSSVPQSYASARFDTATDGLYSDVLRQIGPGPVVDVGILGRDGMKA